MEDLIQCPIIRDDLQRWLDMGTAPITIWQGEQAASTLVRLEKKPSVNYLYRTAMEPDNTISWSNSLMFSGVYDMKHQALYLTRDSLHSLMGGKFLVTAEAGLSVMETISGKINQSVEDIIANDRSNLHVQEVTGYQALQDLRSYREYGAKREAIERFFSDREPDGQFHGGYKLDDLLEAAFIAYLQDPEGFIQSEAEQHIKINQEKFLLQFLKNDALLAEYQALTQDTDDPVHRVKAISKAIRISGAKTVTVTIQKSGQEMSFRTGTSSLRGCFNSYSSSRIAAADRGEFERLFGRYADYKAEDITKITYGKNTIYEALPVQTDPVVAGPEEQEDSQGFTMGGLSL